MQDSVLRSQLAEMLKGGQAHASLGQALEGLKPKDRLIQPHPGVKSVWEVLEHIRIAQEDILRYTLDPDWKSPEFPKGYWPAAAEPLRQVLDDAVWNTSLEGFNSDLNELVDLVADTKVDLTAEIPHTQGHTYLREVLLVADHNAYHIAQIIATRRMLGDWK